MVFEILKGKTSPKYCVVFPETRDFVVTCDIRPDVMRAIQTKEKACLIEFKDGTPYSYCDKGTEILTKLAAGK